MMRGLFHRGRHRRGVNARDFIYAFRQQHPLGTRPVRDLHFNTETGERWLVQHQCGYEPVFLGHLPRLRTEDSP